MAESWHKAPDVLGYCRCCFWHHTIFQHCLLTGLEHVQGEALNWKIKYEDMVQLQQARSQGDVHGEEVHLAAVKLELEAAEAVAQGLHVSQASLQAVCMPLCQHFASKINIQC